MDEQKRSQGADGEARRKRIAQLDREIDRFVQAVADGVAVKPLLERIAAAEEERARLVDEDARTTPSKTTEQLPEVAMYYGRLVKQAEQGFHGDVEKARGALRGLFENGISITPDPKAGGYLVEGKIAGEPYCEWH